MAALLTTNPTPAELLIPGDASGHVKRRLVLRNPLTREELLVKLVMKNGEKAITPRQEWVSVKPGTAVQLEMAIDSTRLSRVGQQLCGYVRVVPESTELAKRWLSSHEETKQQLAFTLFVRPSDAFSAYDTVIDLPGSAVLVEPKTAARFGTDDLGCEDALLLDAGTITARGFDSLENVAADLRKQPSAAAATENVCWLVKRMFNCDETTPAGQKKPKTTALPPPKRTPVVESHYIEPTMNRAV